MLCNSECLPTRKSQWQILDCRAVQVMEANLSSIQGHLTSWNCPWWKDHLEGGTRGLHEASHSPSDLQCGCLVFWARGEEPRGPLRACVPGRHQYSTPSLFGVNSFKYGLPGMGRRGRWRKEGLGRWQQVRGMPNCQLAVRSSWFGRNDALLREVPGVSFFPGQLAQPINGFFFLSLSLSESVSSLLVLLG